MLDTILEILPTIVGIVAAVLLLVGVCLIAVGVSIYRTWSRKIDAYKALLAQLTEARKAKFQIFLSFREENAALAKEVAEFLSSLDPTIIRFDPIALWEDAPEEVVNGIETANAVIYLRGSMGLSDWVRAELAFAESLRVPVLKVRDLDALKDRIRELVDVCETIDLERRLEFYTETERFEKVRDAFEPYIDNEFEDFYDSNFISKVNWAVKQGGKNEDLVAPSLWFFIMGALALVAGIVLGLIWLILNPFF